MLGARNGTHARGQSWQEVGEAAVNGPIAPAAGTSM
jgi:hypothetical protein